MKQEKDIVGKKYIQMVMVLQHLRQEDKKKVWKKQCERLLNVEFPW